MFPKWIMNSETNLVPTGTLLRRARFWQYARLVKGTYAANLVRYWPLRETSGTVARDASNNRGNATYAGVTFGQQGIGDGHQCPHFGTSFVNCYSAAFNTAFPRAAGTIAIWMRVLNAGVWTDATVRRIVFMGINAANTIAFQRTAVNNQLRYVLLSNGGAAQEILTTAYALSTWMHAVIDWDSVANQIKLYLNGNLIGTKICSGGALVGNLSATDAVLGAHNTTALEPFSGYLAHPAIWNVALPAQVIKRLSRF